MQMLSNDSVISISLRSYEVVSNRYIAKDGWVDWISDQARAFDQKTIFCGIVIIVSDKRMTAQNGIMVCTSKTGKHEERAS